jgi:DNA-binding CsgD family transcriptional regulator
MQVGGFDQSFKAFLERNEVELPLKPQGLVICRINLNGFVYVLQRIPRGPLDCLTERQREVAKLAGGGHSLEDIAAMLGLSRPCIAKHLRRVYEKLAVASRAELARRVLALS